MNKLEDELAECDITISAVKRFLNAKKAMSYEDWRNAHMYLDVLETRRDKLLSEKFRGGIL